MPFISIGKTEKGVSLMGSFIFLSDQFETPIEL